jgi:DNA polymerase-3 subunit epsilon
VPIPAEIQWLTGITNAMVREAPPFPAVAGQLAGLLQDGVFVAHNARFDYGFLRAEFARAGIDWRSSTLCTVRLSRHLYPDRAPHTLDAIVARFGLDGEQRHRALGDARVLWRLLQVLQTRHPPAELDLAVRALLSRPATPPNLPPNALDEIPAVPGVYLFHGLNDTGAGPGGAPPIYIGKALDLKARVASHFDNDLRSGADLRLSQEVRRIAFEPTAGEVGALLREAQLVKTLLPAHNIALRRKANAVFVTIDPDGRPHFVKAAALAAAARDGATAMSSGATHDRTAAQATSSGAPHDGTAAPAMSSAATHDGAAPSDSAQAAPLRLADHYGPFASRAAARRALIDTAREHALCLQVMRLDGRIRRATATGCFNLQLARCRGACVGAESSDEHGARVRAVLAALRLPPWPWPGAVALVECCDVQSREDWHVFDRWCWLGTVRTLDAAAALARTATRTFEADTYRIVRRALQRARQQQVIPLE